MSAHGTGAPATGAPGANPAADPIAPTAPATGAPADPPASPPATGTPTPGQDPQELGPAGIEALRKEREARSAAEAELKRYKDAEEKVRQATLTETERLKEQIAKLEKEGADAAQARKVSDLRSVTVSAASRLGYADPDDAFKLLDHSRVEYGDDGGPKNVDALLTELLAAKPHYAARRPPTADFGGGTRGAPNGAPYTMEQIKGMSRDEIVANYDKVKESMAAAAKT